MNLEQFGEELKQARLAKQISLNDIAGETRINLKFLEAIERGQFQILPQTYVRAFLREFALMVSLDPIDIMQQYEFARQDISARKPDEAAPRHTSVEERILSGNFEEQLFSLSPFKRYLTFGLIILAGVLVMIVLATLNKGTESNKPVTEVPFDRVIRESEAASIPPPSLGVDSTPVVVPPKVDSLRLEISTRDSVWISLLIDGKKGEEHLLGPNKKRIWTAKERFAVTMGNAGGATFQLNGKDIGTLGKRGAVVRNTIITEATIKN